MASYTTELLRLAASFDRAQRAYDAMTPPEDDSEERIQEDVESMVNEPMDKALAAIKQFAKAHGVALNVDDSGMDIDYKTVQVTHRAQGTEGKGTREINIVLGDDDQYLDLVGTYAGEFDGDEDGVSWSSSGEVTCTLADGKGHKLWHHEFGARDIKHIDKVVVAELTKVLGKG